MNILIVGCGRVGRRLVHVLERLGHDVSVLDEDAANLALLNELEPPFSGMAVAGVPIDGDVLRSAGIEACDAVAAVTKDDNINLMVAQIARELFGVKHVIARVAEPSRKEVYTERFGLAGAYITKATAQLMRDFGSVQSPQDAFLLNLGLESLHVRMKRHCENGQAVAEFLQSHPKVAWVNYCGLPGNKYYELAQKYLPGGSCGVVSFGVKGGRANAETFMKHLKLAAIETHVADARTCCLHPASATHRQMNDAELEAAGVSPDLVRFSCGLEDSRDLIADIAQALEQV